MGILILVNTVVKLYWNVLKSLGISIQVNTVVKPYWYVLKALGMSRIFNTVLRLLNHILICIESPMDFNTGHFGLTTVLTCIETNLLHAWLVTHTFVSLCNHFFTPFSKCRQILMQTTIALVCNKLVLVGLVPLTCPFPWTFPFPLTFPVSPCRWQTDVYD